MNENVNNNVVCSKCGTANASNTNFCVNCGNNLNPTIGITPSPALPSEEPNINPMPVEPPVNENKVQPPVKPVEQPVYNNVQTSAPSSSPVAGKINFLQYIIGAVLKPFDTFKKDEDNLGNFKNVGILALIVIGVMTVLGILQTILSVVRVASFWTDEVQWVWENLKHINFIKVIGQCLLIYAGILFAISGVYFLASLVIKKEVKFPKLLGAVVTAFIPMALASSLVSPLASLIYSPLGGCITIVGIIYAVVILLELVNDLIKIENPNTRIYFHLICLSILVIGGIFIAYKLVLGSISNIVG